MTELQKFIVKVRELAADAPSILVTMPRNSVGLPEGSFCPQSLLNYIADCLEADINRIGKGV